MQRVAVGVDSAITPKVADVLAAPGVPLESGTRSAMERRMGFDFSRVRIHHDDAAARSAREVKALAYTVGEHVAFDAGHYAPHTAAGRHLLAHELAHVAQGHSGLLRKPADDTAPVSPDEQRLEREAESLADAATEEPTGEDPDFPDEPGLDGEVPHPDAETLADSISDADAEEPSAAPMQSGGAPKGQKKVVKRIVVDLDKQTATAMEDGKPVRTMKISSGKAGHRTTKGPFEVYEVDKDHESSKYGKCVPKKGKKGKPRDVSGGKDSCGKDEVYRGAPMKYFQRFNGAEGFHKGVLPGYPDSHGCVRLSEDNAKWLFNWGGNGTKVDVGPLPKAKPKPKPKKP